MEPLEIIAVVIIMIIFFLFHYWMIRERKNVKTAYYERALISHVYCDSNPVLDRWTKEKETLTIQEREAYQILAKTRRDNLWSYAIRATIDKGSVSEFRKLIDQLYSEGIVAPSTMIKIIGADGWLAVCRCKEGFS